MRIANIMFSRGKGGIEQAFIDYTEALLLAGHDVHSITRRNAAVNGEVMKLAQSCHSHTAHNTIPEYDIADIYGVYILRRILSAINPEVIIAHGNRALSLSLCARSKSADCRPPIVGVTHNYSVERLRKADAIFATTADLKDEVCALGVEDSCVFSIPNMVRMPQYGRTGTSLSHSDDRPPHIGAMGRFVKKKGFHIFIEALGKLNERGEQFTAVLAGGGDEEKALKQQAITAGLEHILEFPGWVEDKRDFFSGIDLFCLPSLHEPFGIVLLEAMAHGVAVITADSEGPSHIVTPDVNACVVPINDAAALASAITEFLRHPQRRNELAAAGKDMVGNNYTIEAVSRLIDNALQQIVIDYSNSG